MEWTGVPGALGERANIGASRGGCSPAVEEDIVADESQVVCVPVVGDIRDRVSRCRMVARKVEYRGRGTEMVVVGERKANRGQNADSVVISVPQPTYFCRVNCPHAALSRGRSSIGRICEESGEWCGVERWNICEMARI